MLLNIEDYVLASPWSLVDTKKGIAI